MFSKAKPSGDCLSAIPVHERLPGQDPDANKLHSLVHRYRELILRGELHLADEMDQAAIYWAARKCRLDDNGLTLDQGVRRLAENMTKPGRMKLCPEVPAAVSA